MSDHFDIDELDYRRRLRELGGPVQPQRELWLGIAARIQAQQPVVELPSPRHRVRWVGGLALAASVLVAVGALLQMGTKSPAEGGAALAHADSVAPALARTDADIKALPNRDPRLAGAVIEVDSATQQLQQSLQHEPGAVFLVGLLNRNYERRLKLARLASS